MNISNKTNNHFLISSNMQSIVKFFSCLKNTLLRLFRLNQDGNQAHRLHMADMALKSPFICDSSSFFFFSHDFCFERNCRLKDMPY